MNAKRRQLIWSAPALTVLLAANAIPAKAIVGYNARVTSVEQPTVINGTNPSPPYGTPGDGRDCPNLDRTWWSIPESNWSCWFKYHLGLI